MTENQWIDIKEALNLLEASKVQKIVGNGWMIYKVGLIIRIDLEKEVK